MAMGNELAARLKVHAPTIVIDHFVLFFDGMFSLQQLLCRLIQVRGAESSCDVLQLLSGVEFVGYISFQEMPTCVRANQPAWFSGCVATRKYHLVQSGISRTPRHMLQVLQAKSYNSLLDWQFFEINLALTWSLVE